MSKITPFVTISGATLSGMTLALLLKQGGIRVEIVEQGSNKFWQKNSSPTIISPAAYKIFRRLDLDLSLLENGKTLSKLSILKNDESLQQELDFSQESDSFCVSIQKSTLLRILAQKVILNNIPIYRKCHVTSFQSSQDDVYVRFNRDRSSLHFDLLVDADDALNSRIASSFSSQRHPLGFISQTLSLKDFKTDKIIELRHGDKKIILVPCENEEYFVSSYFVTPIAHKMKDGPFGNSAELENRVKVFSGPISKLLIKELANVTSDTPYQVEYARNRTLEQYSFGRVAIIGDAANPLLPYYGQRESLQLGNAETLADFLNEHKNDFNEALKRYNEDRLIQIPKVSKAIMESIMPVEEQPTLKDRLSKTFSFMKSSSSSQSSHKNPFTINT